MATLKEAVLRTLGELKKPVSYKDVCKHIIKHSYVDFSNAKTPEATISAILGDFIRKGDQRVRRIKSNSKLYHYYLKENEEIAETKTQLLSSKKRKANTKSYREITLHKLLCTYLKTQNVLSKTIYHEKSTRKDENQKWIHPDMIGVTFKKLKSKVAKSLFRTINRSGSLTLTSYEIKKVINNDSELKKAFFQAVSNSSWANFGYLAAFDISDSLQDEMERLNKSFGIGIIRLEANPFECTELFPALYRDLDFNTIDKLSYLNNNFREFMIEVDKVITADEKYIDSLEKSLVSKCDTPLDNDEEKIRKYCLDNNIPIDTES